MKYSCGLCSRHLLEPACRSCPWARLVDDEVLARFRQILAVIGWAVQFCPECMEPRRTHHWSARCASALDDWWRRVAESHGVPASLLEGPR